MNLTSARIINQLSTLPFRFWIEPLKFTSSAFESEMRIQWFNCCSNCKNLFFKRWTIFFNWRYISTFRHSLRIFMSNKWRLPSNFWFFLTCYVQKPIIIVLTDITLITYEELVGKGKVQTLVVSVVILLFFIHPDFEKPE